MESKFWASALLVDGRIKFWKVSPNKKSSVEDFYKDFYYSNEKMTDYIDNPKCTVENKLLEINDEISNKKIFEELAPQWFSQWDLIEGYKGEPPYYIKKRNKLCNVCGKEFDIYDFHGGYVINHTIGYGSRYDFNKINLNMCCDCFDKILDYILPQCKINPLTEYKLSRGRLISECIKDELYRKCAESPCL